jgi:hypothetical protein
MKNTLAVVYVPRGTPITECPPERLNSSRTNMSKSGYSYAGDFPCPDHDDFHYGCPDCVTKTVTYTAEDMLQSAIEIARTYCSCRQDAWVVDGETRHVIAAFRMTIERLV